MIEGLRVGQLAKVRLLAGEGELEARVTQLGLRANSAGLYPLTLLLTRQIASATPGQTVELQLITSESQTLLIPLSAYVMDAAGQAYVFEYLPDSSSLTRRPVTLGQFNQQTIEVLNGLPRDTLIVLKGGDLLHEGQQVQAISDVYQRYGN